MSEEAEYLLIPPISTPKFSDWRDFFSEEKLLPPPQL
jgi:hypothetical protein